MKNRKHIRLEGYNYNKDGYYFVTLCSARREPFTIDEKEIIKNHLRKISLCDTAIMVDYYVVMDNHVHCIFILQKSLLSLGEIVRRFKARVTKDAGHPLWQANYYEHVIRNDKALTKIRKYTQNNPLQKQIEFKNIYD